ncbi:MAG: IPTL-CTERM sorting domain-containing protein [Holophagales bacterium]|nr:IPTL-CTERM sorting domain-containing protein [Holophagales bacterium]
MLKTKGLSLLATAGIAVLLGGGSPAAAQTAPPLGVVQQFSVLGNSGVTGSTGTGTVVTGDVGSYPTPTITNFPPSSVAPPFTLHTTSNATVQQAHSDAIAAYNFLALQGPGTVLPAQLNGQALTSGIYSFTGGAADLANNGTLTLNGGGVFIFQVDTSLTANTGSNIVGTADPCNVYWRVGTSASLLGTSFRGNVFADASITIGSGANVTGRAIAGTGATGAVTMSGSGGNSISGCARLACPPLTILPATLPNPVVGTLYSQPITASGSTPDTYVYTVTAGALPPGLGLDSVLAVKTVNLTGTPTTPGSYSFTITATDANGCEVSQAYSVVVAPAGCPTVTVLPATLPNPVLGVLYAQTISATGGASPYVYSVSAGALPPGLLLSPLTATPTASLSGTPTATGSFNFTITAVDANGCPGTRDYTVFVDRATGVPTLSTWGLLILMALTGLVSTWYLRRAA